MIGGIVWMGNMVVQEPQEPTIDGKTFEEITAELGLDLPDLWIGALWHDKNRERGTLADCRCLMCRPDDEIHQKRKKERREHLEHVARAIVAHELQQAVERRMLFGFTGFKNAEE